MAAAVGPADPLRLPVSQIVLHGKITHRLRNVQLRTSLLTALNRPKIGTLYSILFQSFAWYHLTVTTWRLAILNMRSSTSANDRAHFLLCLWGTVDLRRVQGALAVVSLLPSPLVAA